MNYTTETLSLTTHKSDCLVIPVYDGKDPGSVFTEMDKLSHNALSKYLKSGDIKAKFCQVSILVDVPRLPCSRIVFVGMGAPKPLTASQYRKLANEISRYLIQLPAKQLIHALCFEEAAEKDVVWQVRQWIFALSDMMYTFTECKTPNPNQTKPTVKQLTFVAKDKPSVRAIKAVITESVAITQGMKLAKDLGNLPANICTPSYLSRAAQNLAKQYKSIKISILSSSDMYKLGMHSLLSVAKGSDEPAALIVMEYRGAKKAAPPVALVGKGITFDSGGISIKPSLAMDEMKYDMCGAASVIGTIHAIAELELPMNVVGVVAATENLPSGKATKPGDIVKSLSGQTIEILNTDAEGRLVLCDALTYVKKYKPEVVIDIATLTGAMIVALGGHPAGLMSNNDELSADLEIAGNDSFDRVWRLPLWEDYQEQLDSNFADIANIGSGKGAGSIVAACFLERFARDFNWAHLDIAGVAWNSGKGKGSTGRPVPLLTQYLINRCNNAQD